VLHLPKETLPVLYKPEKAARATSSIGGNGWKRDPECGIYACGTGKLDVPGISRYQGRKALRISAGSATNLLSNDHVALPSSVTGVQIHSLKDSGATGLAFIDSSFARKHNFPLTPLPEARTLKVFDGRDTIAGKVTDVAFLPFSINSHHEQIPFFVTKLSQYPVVLGLPWLRLHDVTSKWAANTVRFESLYCKRHYLVKGPFIIHSYVPEIKKRDAPLKLNIA
jgi:hypothetical protein